MLSLLTQKYADISYKNSVGLIYWHEARNNHRETGGSDTSVFLNKPFYVVFNVLPLTEIYANLPREIFMQIFL